MHALPCLPQRVEHLPATVATVTGILHLNAKDDIVCVFLQLGRLAFAMYVLTFKSVEEVVTEELQL